MINLVQAAELLAGFDFSATGYCVVELYFVDKAGKVVSSGFDTYSVGKVFKSWNREQWSERIVERAEVYSKIELVRIASVRIVFSDKNDSDAPLKLYGIEATDLSKSDCFDRLIVYALVPGEVYLDDADDEFRYPMSARDVIACTQKALHKKHVKNVRTLMPKVVANGQS